MYDDTQSIWVLMNGSAKADASVLNNSMLGPYTPYPSPNGAANVTKTFNINQTDPVVWVIDKAPHAKATTPVIYGRISDGWTQARHCVCLLTPRSISSCNSRTSRWTQ